MSGSLAQLRENLRNIGTTAWEHVVDNVSYSVIDPLVKKLYALRGRGMDLAVQLNRLMAQIMGADTPALALPLVARLEQTAAQSLRFVRARAAADLGWSQGTQALSRDLIERVRRGLMDAAKVAEQARKRGDLPGALKVWGHAQQKLREGLWDHLVNTRQDAPLWAHLPPAKTAALKKQVAAALEKMRTSANIVNGFDYAKLEHAIHDLYRALHDVLDATEEHGGPAVSFKGAEREDFSVGGTPVVLEYQADKKAEADRARKVIEEVLHDLHQGASRAGASWLRVPPVVVSYAGHPGPRALVLSLGELARAQPKVVLQKLAHQLGERIYDHAPGGVRADWNQLMAGYWTEFTIRNPANNVELDRAKPREGYAAALAGLLLHGKNYLDPKVLAGVLALGRASRAG